MALGLGTNARELSRNQILSFAFSSYVPMTKSSPKAVQFTAKARELWQKRSKK